MQKFENKSQVTYYMKNIIYKDENYFQTISEGGQGIWMREVYAQMWDMLHLLPGEVHPIPEPQRLYYHHNRKGPLLQSCS